MENRGYAYRKCLARNDVIEPNDYGELKVDGKSL